MANFKLTQTGEQIQADLDLLDKNSATSGQVLTANGTGGASWQDPSEVEVVQATGTSTTSVMSQKAVTDAIATAITTALNTAV